MNSVYIQDTINMTCTGIYFLWGFVNIGLLMVSLKISSIKNTGLVFIDSNTSNQFRDFSNLKSMQCTALLLFQLELIACLNPSSCTYNKFNGMEFQNHPGSYLMDPLIFCNSKEDHLTIKEQRIMKATNCMITLRVSSHLEFVVTTGCFEFLCVFKRHFWLRYNLRSMML